MFSDLPHVPPALYDSFRDAVYDHEQPPMRALTVDLMVLQDYRLGGVVLSCRTNDEYDYVFARLQQYENTWHRYATREFPELGLAEGDLRQLLTDGNKQIALAATSPMTELWGQIPHIMQSVHNHNRMCNLAGPVEVTILCPEGITPPPHAAKRISAPFLSGDAPTTVTFYSGAYTDLSSRHLEKTAVWIVDEPVRFLQTPSILAYLNEYGLARNVTVMARNQVEDQHLCLSDEELIQIMRNSELVFSYCSTFLTFPHRLLRPEADA